jgi:hypothetical protein
LRLNLSLTLPPPDNGQYHNLLPWMIRHQAHLNALAYLSEYGQPDVGFPIRRHPSKFMNVMMLEHYTFDWDFEMY